MNAAGAAPACWCGNAALEAYSTGYALCARCGTLVTRSVPQADLTHVRDERRDFYGASYFFERARARAQPDLAARAHLDLPERCAHWLKALLAYRPPPAQILEIGCSSGAFVGLLACAGYDAAGLDLSPEVTALARAAFEVPVLTGPIEEQGLSPASLDGVVIMDVLEHLAEPERTLAAAARALRPDGLLLVQTPCFDPALSYAALESSGHAFRAMLQPEEHLYLFSRASAGELMRRLGFAHLSFVPAYFDMYDMCFLASRAPLLQVGASDWRAALRRTRGGRIAEALIDAHDGARARVALQQRLDQVEVDRARRHDVILEQQRELTALRGELGTMRQALAARPLRRALHAFLRRRAQRAPQGGEAR